MKQKEIKRMGRKVSAMGLGCWGFSGSETWDKSNDENSISVIHMAIERGINLFDVAPVYGLGHAEVILGKALKGKERDKLVIATKCGLVWDNTKNVTNNLSAKSITKEIDESLIRLGIDYIDIYQLHWPDPQTDINETIDCIQKLKARGKIRHLGVSNFSNSLVQEIMKKEEIVSQQGLYNMLERNPESYHNIPLEYRTENETLPQCIENDQAFFPYSPLFQGLLTGSFQSSQNFSKEDVRSKNPKLNDTNFSYYFTIVKKLNDFAKKMGKPLNEIALNWLISNPAVTSVIAGALCNEHLEKNLCSLEWELTDEMKREIDKIIM